MAESKEYIRITTVGGGRVVEGVLWSGSSSTWSFSSSGRKFKTSRFELLFAS